MTHSAISLGVGLGGGKASTSSGRLPSGGAFENALSGSFDGANDYLQPSSAISFTGAFTLSMWFKQTTNALGILVYGNTAYIEPSGSTGRVLVEGSAYGGNILSATNSYTFGQWSHFMLAKDSSNAVEMWVNGESGGTGTSSGTATFSEFGIYALGIQPFGGEFDEISLFDSDQSANIATIYNSGVPADLRSLRPLHWWRMGDGTGDTDSGGGAPVNGDTIGTVVDQGSGGNNAAGKNGPTYSNDVPS